MPSKADTLHTQPPVWRLKCRHEAMIASCSGAIESDDLLLLGKCAECHGDVAWVVEAGKEPWMWDGKPAA